MEPMPAIDGSPEGVRAGRAAGAVSRCRGGVRPGFAKCLPRCSPSCEVSGAPKDAAVARLQESLATALHAWWACLGPLAVGDPRLSALHHGVFVRPSPTHLGPRLPIRTTGVFARIVQQSSLRTSPIARRAGSEAPRES